LSSGKALELFEFRDIPKMGKLNLDGEFLRAFYMAAPLSSLLLEMESRNCRSQ